MVERIGGVEVEVLVFRVAHGEPAPFEPPGDAFGYGVQQPDDAATERSQQLGQFIGLESAGAVKGSLGAPECVGPIEEQHVQVRVERQPR